MMATPIDLEYFVAGFAHSEGLARPEEIKAVQPFETGGGWLVRANLPARSCQGSWKEPDHGFRKALRNLRNRLRRCRIGADRPRKARPEANPEAIHKALGAIRARQELDRATGALHAAAFCSFAGEILGLREDVGRHNVLDKLIGALRREGLNPEQGFVLLSARCSQELVEKTVRSKTPMLVTISAPSSLAIARAREGRLTLLALARSDSALVINDPHRLFKRKKVGPAFGR